MDHRFQVNLSGIIELLSNNLYSGPEVCFRELLQNAVDAITARRALTPGFEGAVRLELVRDSGTPPTLTCEDDGVGLTESEVHRFLATIGESSKRTGRDEQTDFIGQFGIGLLSCFMLADEIVMVTRSGREPAAPAVEWRGKPDGTYSVRVIEQDLRPGTRVYLRCRPGRENYFDPDTVLTLTHKYGGLLPIPIDVTVDGKKKRINQEPVWCERFTSEADRRAALMEFGKDVFDTEFFDAIPLAAEAGGVEGVAYVLPYSPSPSAKGRHRIYLKRMLLSEAGEGVLPEWAFFVRCVINATALRPTASREQFYEDDALEETRDELGRVLRQYLLDLSRKDPARLGRLLSIHYLAIKALAVHDAKFYGIFIDFIPFETSLGVMTMSEIRRRSKRVRFVPTVDEFRQVSRVAAAQGVCLINGGYTYNEELVTRLPRVFRNVEVERVGAGSISQSFDELSLDEREQVMRLLSVADLALQPYQCLGEVRKFEPAELPALLTIGSDATLYRTLEQNSEVGESDLSDIFREMLAPDGVAPRARLVLNFKNDLIQRLTIVSDRQLLRQCLEVMYVQALLLGHHPLAAKELALLNGGLAGLIRSAVRGVKEQGNEGESKGGSHAG